MDIVPAQERDIPALYRLQLLAFESEAEMIGSRAIPALQETESHFRADFPHWHTLKLIDETGTIQAAIRYQNTGFGVEIGRLMVHPDVRRRGLAQKLLAAVDSRCPGKTKTLYTCSKSTTNLLLYEKMGYTPYKTHTESSGLSFVHLKKD